MRLLYVLLLALVLAAGAQADGIFYTVTGTYSTLLAGGDNALGATGDAFQFTFSLPTDPTTDVSFTPGPDSFTLLAPTTYTFGANTLTGVATIEFLDTLAGGMMTIFFPGPGTMTGELDLQGPLLFSGTTSAPTLLFGLFSAGGPNLYTVTDITGVLGQWTVTNAQVEGVPEPSTWGFMIGAILLAAPKLARLRKRS